MLEDFVYLHPEALGEALPEEKHQEGAGDGQQSQAHPPVGCEFLAASPHLEKRL